MSTEDKAKDKGEDNVEEAYRETMEELMLDLKVKTDVFLKKLKEQNKKTRIDF